MRAAIPGPMSGQAPRHRKGHCHRQPAAISVAFQAGICVLAVLCLLAATAHARVVAQTPPVQVSVQLKWTHQFQFAGIYAALARGYYRDAGLEVGLLPGGPEVDPVQTVVLGRAEFGIGNSSLLIDRAAGKPIQVLAPILQHSPFVILARREAGLETVRDLPGHVLGLEEHAAECLAYLHRSEVDIGRVKMVPHPGNVLAMEDGRIDAISAYTTTEPYDLIQAQVSYQVFSPREVGIDFYGDTLFVNEAFAAENPEAVRAFRDATIRGWTYALAHTTEVIDLILRDYAPQLNHLKLGFEAEEIKRLMLIDIVDIGYSSPARWRHIAQVFAEAGMMPADYPLDGFVFENDLQPDQDWLYLTLAGVLAVLVLVSLVAHRFYRFSRALRQELVARQALEAELSALARTDELPRLPNRRSFFERAEAMLREAQEAGRAFSIVAFDIDRFKAINDTWGHAAGDRALEAVADACLAYAPEDAILARIGGEEFAVALPGRGARDAAAVAERMRAAVAQLRGAWVAAPDMSLTASFGVGATTGGSSLDGLISIADAAMYVAKRAGGDRVSVMPEDAALSGA